MPSARSATAASRARAHASHQSATRTHAPRPRRLSGPAARRRSRARVRWDRVGRVALLVVLGVVGVLYIEHAIAYLSARSRFDAENGTVRQLERDNARLVVQQRLLRDPATIVLDARKLGMVRPGERSYVISSSGN